jgi:Protein of unknown function (DUF3072)
VYAAALTRVRVAWPLAGNPHAMTTDDPNPKTDPETAQGASNLEKDPSDWVSGEEPMTEAQASYLRTLAERAGESFDPNLTKAQASERIDELQARTGRSRR